MPSARPAPPPLVGRGKELHTLESLLDGLGGGRFLAIEGEPGIGKSRLLSELIALAEDRRMLPLAGRAAAVEADVPFAPLRDALDDYVASRDPRELEPAGATGRADLARVLPALGGEPSPPPAGEERYRAHHAVRALLDGLATRRPVLLALDDLQWADGASAELLAHLLRHPPRRKVAVALTWRAGQCPPALAAAVAEAARAGDVERIELRPLGPRDSRSLIAATTSASRLDPILRLAEGNPFYLSELSRSWGAEADPQTPEGGVPAAVAAAIVAELEEVPAGARALARAGSVLGEEFEAAMAAEVAAVTEPASVEALDALLERDLVRRTDSPRRFAFRHPIVRESVYESMPAGERSRLHGDAADALERAGADLTARAPHVEESASAPDASAAALLNKAGMEAMASAPSAAAHWLTAALELTPPGDSGTRLAHLIALARALAGCGEYERALDALEEILSLLPADELRGRARAVAAIAEVLALLGRHGEAHQQLVAGLAALPAAATAEATLLRLQLAADAFYSADFEGMDLQVTAALADAEARGDRSIIAAATGLRSASLYLRDRVPEARGELDEAIALTRGLEDEELAEHLPSHGWTALGAVFLERFDDAVNLLERTIAVALGAGRGHLPALLRTTEALALIWRGRLAEAAGLLDAAVEASILTRNPIFLAWGRSLKAWAELIAGDLPHAVELGERSLAAAEAADDPLTATAACHLADALVASGSPERARDVLVARAGGPELPRIERPFRPRAYEILTRAEIGIGDAAAADGWATRARRCLSAEPIEGRRADALRAAAAVAIARGEAPVAVARAREALAAAARAGLPIELGRARTLLGRALLAAGDADAASAELDGARTELGELGAGHYRDEAARELRRLGKRVPRPSPADGGTLTRREREIADLVVAGRRNAEIADALFLSVRTVEGHLSRIYAKLGVASRTQLAAMSREPG